MIKAALVFFALILIPVGAIAEPNFVYHSPSDQVYGEASGVTMRESDVPREDETVDLWVRIGYSFYYTDVAIYYTTDGTDPQGSFGSPGSASTSVLRSSAGGVTFIRNEPASPANIDWWKATLPASTRTYGLTIKYKIGAWHSGGGSEVFANDSSPVFSYNVKLAWPGKGSPNSNPGAGYPNIHLWKEEAVVGNNWMNVQLDMNGSIYDIYYPSAGCVQGVGTKNEGYVDGYDTFPPGLPLGYRGQMNMNMGCAGLRVDGVTYWLTNEGGAYSNVAQAYVQDTNVVRSSQIFTANSNNIAVEQYDYCPKGVTFTLDSAGTPVRGIHIKRVLLTNNGSFAKTINFYYFIDPAINGGDSYDIMSFDPALGAMTASDTTYRTTSTSGEYNPNSFSDYTKNVSISFASALKLCPSVGSESGSIAADSWRDSSTDNNQGWIGLKLTLQPGQQREVDMCTIGGWKQGAGDPGAPSIYSGQITPALNWFYQSSAADLETATENYWRNWLASGVTASFPDPRYDSLFKRSLLATALHIDEKGGGVIAGMHNGAYPFVWPRDAVYAAITLDRTGHFSEAENVYRFLRDVAYRAEEEPGRKGFWYQKYSTDGYMIWTAPQVDETAVVPWGVKYHYDCTGDINFLNANYQMVYEAARASSEDSRINTNLYYDDAANLMHSNNVWEDSWDDFLYSNACVERGLKDASALASATGHSADAFTFNSRADSIHSGILSRLDWDGENTDISQLGISYPFGSLQPDDPRMAHILARINGTATDRWGNNHPIAGSTNPLASRYWGDSYWHGGPWFLSTLWYGQFYAMRQDHNPGKTDINALKISIDALRNQLGPVGLGAEQVAPLNSLLYPGFYLQAAWPNAWESMSTFVDALMMFLDFRPDAPDNSFQIAPKLPTPWSSITFNNLRVGSSTFSVACSESTNGSRQIFTLLSGPALNFNTIIRIPANSEIVSVTQNLAPIAYVYSPTTGQVHVMGTLSPPGSQTTLIVTYGSYLASTVQQLKSLSPGTSVCLSDVVVTRVHGDRFNVETSDRTSGIAVIGTGATRGMKVKLIGTAGVSGAERVLNLISILEQTPADGVPGPVAMAGKSAGGSNFGQQPGASASGLNNIGLDVTMFGRITKIADDGSWISIDDGSGFSTSTVNPGIRLIGALNPTRFAEGQFIRATGSMSIEQVDGINYPLVRIAQAEDVMRE